LIHDNLLDSGSQFASEGTSNCRLENPFEGRMPEMRDGSHEPHPVDGHVSTPPEIDIFRWLIVVVWGPIRETGFVECPAAILRDQISKSGNAPGSQGLGSDGVDLELV